MAQFGIGASDKYRNIVDIKNWLQPYFMVGRLLGEEVLCKTYDVEGFQIFNSDREGRKDLYYNSDCCARPYLDEDSCWRKLLGKLRCGKTILKYRYIIQVE